VTVHVEIRDFGAYVHSGGVRGAGGMPYKSSGRAMVLLSGGIDSPVAAFLMAKRGLEIVALHFETPPYTSERAKEKVNVILDKLSEYTSPIKLITVNLTDISLAIRENCKADYFTIILRRFMMRIAERFAAKEGCGALITGESLAQVASQTLMSLAATDSAVTMPVFRPLIGMDKEEIIRIAREIDTYETSILPFDDCCTVFTPPHPKTKPRISDVVKVESVLDVEGLISDATLSTFH
jgi:thiamine biosynthesis protein ThiI